MGTEGDLSIVSVGGEYESSCGYCHSDESSSVAFGMTAKQLTVEVYQDLLDRGWRRSGTWLYLPIYDKTCCPCYTHRLDVTKFIPNKAQLKAQRRFEAYLQKPEGNVASAQPHAQEAVLSASSPQRVATKSEEDTVQNRAQLDVLAKHLHSAAQVLKAKGLLPQSLQLPVVKVHKPKKASLAAAGVRYTSPFAFTLAALASKTCSEELGAARLAVLLVEELRLEGNLHPAAAIGHVNFLGPALGSRGDTGLQDQEGSQPLVIRDEDSRQRLQETGAEPNGLGQELDSQCQPGEMRSSLAQDEPSLTNNSKVRGHRKGVKRDASSLAKGKRDLKIIMRQSSPELVELEFSLYRKYQVHQHNDPPYKVTPSSFKRFLIDSPLVFVPPQKGKTPPCGYGSFHQQYWIEGVLVAVGVVDVLPSCLSSKYFFWDPDLAHLALGRISALKEIEWVQAAHLTCPQLKYYYMGFYIHTCPKMRYKIDFAPADLLCPRQLMWIPFDRVEKFLDNESSRSLFDAPKATVGLGTEYIPTHKQGHAQGDCTDALALKALIDRPWAKSPPLRFSEHLRLETISQGFLDFYSTTLERLAKYIGPVAKDIAISI